MTIPTRTRRRTSRPGALCRALLLPVALGAALAGCATASSSSRYQPPAAVIVPGETEVDASLAPTRERLIAALSAEGLVLDEVSAGGPVLLFALETNQPRPYVDCGAVRHDFTDARGETETATVPLAGRAQYRSATAEGAPARISHRADLSADARVVLTALGTRTRVAVAARYEVIITEVAQPLDRDGRPAGPVTQETTEIRFTSDQPAEPQDGKPGCVSTGALERRILEAAEG